MLLLPMLVLAGVVVVSAVISDRRRRRGGAPVEGAVLMRIGALALMAALCGLGGLFIIGETFADPGGLEAALLVAAWLVPMVALCLLAWLRPDAAVPVLGAAVGAVFALQIWFLLDQDGWRTFEDRNGPVRTVVMFAVMLPLALLGWRRPFVGGLLLLAVAVVPWLMNQVAEGGVAGGAALAALAMPAVLAGMLDLLSADRRRHPTGPAPAGHAP